MYSGPVAAHAYRLLRGPPFDVAVLVGPSHFVGVRRRGRRAFRRLRDAIRRRADRRGLRRRSLCGDDPRPRASVGARSRALARDAVAVSAAARASRADRAAVDGLSDRATRARALGDALAVGLRGRRALLVASTDLSHYHDAATAARLDARRHRLCLALRRRRRCRQRSTRQPEHACGGGPTVAVMRAARQLGAADAIVLNYADSGDVSGDKSAVVGYLGRGAGPVQTCNNEKLYHGNHGTDRGHG